MIVRGQPEARKSVEQNLSLVIVQSVLPHYRVPFFQMLSDEPKVDLTLVCGDSLLGLESVETSGIKRLGVDNRVLPGNSLVFQRLPSLAYTAPVVVLEFNPRVLSNYPLILWRILTRRPFIFWGHGISPRKESPRWIVILRKALAHLSGALILYSEKGRQDFIRLGIRPEKLFVAPNTIDLDAIWQAKEHQPAQERDQIIYIGRLIAAKKVELLVNAFSQIHERLPAHIGLTIIGDGPEREDLQHLAAQSKASGKITFTGPLTEQSDIAPYMMRALVSVSPGYIGLSAVHSLAYGVPLLVARDEPHSPEIDAMEPGKTGEFYAPNTPKALGQALLEMLEDPAALAQASRDAVESIQTKFSLENMVCAFTDSYHFVLRNHRGTSE